MIGHLILYLIPAISLMLAPFIPMLREVFSGSDGKPSEIPQDQAVDPRRGIEQILWYHVHQLGVASIAQLRDQQIGRASCRERVSSPV